VEVCSSGKVGSSGEVSLLESSASRCQYNHEQKASDIRKIARKHVARDCQGNGLYHQYPPNERCWRSRIRRDIRCRPCTEAYCVCWIFVVGSR